jgi:hypothetical protein
MASLAACGGSEEETQCSQLVAVLTAGLGCIGTVTVTSPPPPPPPVNPPPASPPRSGHFLVYLCADSCTESPQTDRVYLMVYGQSQSTLASTAVGGLETQHLGVDLVAGLAYYVEVNGYNTGSTAEDYKRVIID